MPAVSAYAPGKIILFGEHAVVYNRPAIAVPVYHVRARAEVTANPKGAPGSISILAPQIQIEGDLESLDTDHPFAVTIAALRSHWGDVRLPAMKLRVSSTIPMAAGLGSSAAVAVAILRAVSRFVGRALTDEEVSRLAYTVEQRQHGNPSGIDNTVVTYEKPVYYRRGEPLELLEVAEPFTLVIANTGVQSSTGQAVAGVRARWQQDTPRYEAIFDRIGEISLRAKEILQHGPLDGIGPLMNENQNLLREMGVSSVELDRLVEAARDAGALGAKLSGGGCGGNMIALPPPGQEDVVAEALRNAGAVQTITTTIPITRREG